MAEDKAKKVFKRLSEQQIRDIARVYQSGKSAQATAQELKLTVGQVRSCIASLVKNGVKFSKHVRSVSGKYAAIASTLNFGEVKK